jgi:hypothetical protein
MSAESERTAQKSEHISIYTYSSLGLAALLCSLVVSVCAEVTEMTHSPMDESRLASATTAMSFVSIFFCADILIDQRIMGTSDLLGFVCEWLFFEQGLACIFTRVFIAYMRVTLSLNNLNDIVLLWALLELLESSCPGVWALSLLFPQRVTSAPVEKIAEECNSTINDVVDRKNDTLNKDTPTDVLESKIDARKPTVSSIAGSIELVKTEVDARVPVVAWFAGIIMLKTVHMYTDNDEVQLALFVALAVGAVVVAGACLRSLFAAFARHRTVHPVPVRSSEAAPSKQPRTNGDDEQNRRRALLAVCFALYIVQLSLQSLHFSRLMGWSHADRLVASMWTKVAIIILISLLFRRIRNQRIIENKVNGTKQLPFSLQGLRVCRGTWTPSSPSCRSCLSHLDSV